jgi:hypothetical protein
MVTGSGTCTGGGAAGGRGVEVGEGSGAAGVSCGGGSVGSGVGAGGVSVSGAVGMGLGVRPAGASCAETGGPANIPTRPTARIRAVKVIDSSRHGCWERSIDGNFMFNISFSFSANTSENIINT